MGIGDLATQPHHAPQAALDRRTALALVAAGVAVGPRAAMAREHGIDGPAIAALRLLLDANILPFWRRVCTQSPTEGYELSIAPDGTPLPTPGPRTLVLQARTTFFFARLARSRYGRRSDLAIAQRRGISWKKLGGTIQNDMLKEFIAQKEWISPPEPSVRVVADMIEFCTAEAPRWHAVSISGYHIREAGSTAVQELAFTLADGIAYVEEVMRRGRLKADDFGHRLSFFFDVHNDFFEEIAKLRAARRLWARIMRERFGATKDEACRLRMHAQTAGVTLTAQQPLNNVVRVAMQALAAVLGGVQSLHTNSFDETLALPTEESVMVALRTQQIIANTVDPLGGSYAIEALTDSIEKAAEAYIAEIDRRGGMVKAIEQGYPQLEIAESAYRDQQRFDKGEQVIVGVNKYTVPEERPVDILRIPIDLEERQIERVKRFKQSRDRAGVQAALERVRAAAASDANLMPPLVQAVQVGCTVGEISDIYRSVFGEYRDPAHL